MVLPVQAQDARPSVAPDAVPEPIGGHVKETEPMQVTVVTSPACHFCDDAQAALAELAHAYPLEVRLVDASSAEGQALVSRHGAGMFPLVLVEGSYFSAGRLPQRKLARLLAGQASTPAGTR
jgi:hypothetical protein